MQLNGRLRIAAILVPIALAVVGGIFGYGKLNQKVESNENTFQAHLGEVKEGYKRLGVVENNQTAMTVELQQMKEILKEIRQELKEMNRRQ